MTPFFLPVRGLSFVHAFICAMPFCVLYWTWHENKGQQGLMIGMMMMTTDRQIARLW